MPYTYPTAKWVAEEARRQITTGCGGGNFCPSSYVTRAAMAGLIVHAFDLPYKVDPATPRNLQFAYTQGLLTGVTGAVTYGTLSYYPNLLVSQVTHANGLTETQANDPHEMRRPASLGASGSYSSWSSGTYGYDGAGNIKTIGNATFTYDSVNRLVASTLYDGPNSDGNQKLQSYTFDAFGNLTNIGGTSGRTTPTSSQTNRLNGTGTAYDAAGNLTNWNTAVYQYDDFNQMVHMTSGTEDWAYVYTADDERIWMYSIAANTSRWTIRDLGGKVLREYLNNKGAWSVGTDYIYRDGLLLAAETQSGQRHFHLDHLGTPRLITRGSGYSAAYHVYYPFGEEATAFNQDTERMKFTGHERDLASPSGASDDLDYMHARHESPVTGRFLSIDSVEANPREPLSWNRYTYALNNPVLLIDPTGKLPVGDWWKRIVQSIAAHTGITLVRDAAVREKYVSTVSGLDPKNSAGRTAAKLAARAGTSPAGRAMAEAIRPISKESSRVGGTASKTNVAINDGMEAAGGLGKGLIVVGVAVSAANIATAPEGQRVEAASKEAGSWVGALAGGETGAEGGATVGFLIGGPPGALVGAVVGGAGGAIVGGVAGAKAGDNVYHLFAEDDN